MIKPDLINAQITLKKNTEKTYHFPYFSHFLLVYLSWKINQRRMPGTYDQQFISALQFFFSLSSPPLTRHAQAEARSHTAHSRANISSLHSKCSSRAELGLEEGSVCLRNHTAEEDAGSYSPAAKGHSRVLCPAGGQTHL